MAQFDADLQMAQTTLKNFEPKNKITDISKSVQEYHALSMLSGRNRMSVSSGTQIQFQIRVNTLGNATWTKPDKAESTNTGQTQIQGQVPFRHCRYDYALDERIIAGNREPSRLYDMWKDARESGEIDNVELIENAFWNVAAVDDDETMYGVFNYVTAVGATTTLGLNGTLPTGWSTVANVNPSTYAQWANRNGLYGTISKTGLVRMAREAATKCKYTPPIDVPSYSTGYKNAYYTNYAVYGKFEEELEKQNQSLGNDVASKDGQVMFRRAPVNYIAQLDGNAVATNPFIGLNWGSLKAVFLKGEVWKELPVMRDPQNFRRLVVRTYATLNLIAYNRRDHFILTPS